VKVKYELEEDGLHIYYQAESDKPTVLNLTNHSYFNLSGAGDPTVLDHLLRINADTYLPTDADCIPYGAPEPVKDTPMDFSELHAIGRHINDDFLQLKQARGYDHTYILKKEPGSYGFCATCISPKTGIRMDVFTDQPGVQLYTGNWTTGDFAGKNGQRYPRQSTLSLETQHYPDSPNHKDYPTTVLRPDKPFTSTTFYRFGIAAD
jgi:aldose 1-epimerase